MGKAQRDKGYRVERKVVDLLKSHGFHAERVPLSGSAGGSHTGDIILASTYRIEVKGRAPQKVYWRQIESQLNGNEMLFLWEDRRPEPLVVMEYSFLRKLLS